MGIKTIARNMKIDPKTVRTHIKDINDDSDRALPNENAEPANKGDGIMENLPNSSVEKPENSTAESKDDGEIASKIFTMLDEGKKPVDAVKELHLSPLLVKAYVLKWAELKALEINEPTILQRIDAVEKEINSINENLKNTPIYGIKKRFKCSECGTEGWIAAKVKCTVCDHESYWGWHAENCNKKIFITWKCADCGQKTIRLVKLFSPPYFTCSECHGNNWKKIKTEMED
jgi:predicted transcriptional regulator